MVSSREALAPRASTTLDAVRQILGTLAARNHADEVLTCVRQIPAREATFRPLPEWVRPELREAYRGKGIAELYSHQAATAELVHNGKNVVVVTPTASGKTLCYNLPVLNEVLENPDTRAPVFVSDESPRPGSIGGATREALAQLRRAHQSVMIAADQCRASKLQFEHRRLRLERKTQAMALSLFST
jgi:hypothetical protein